MKNFLFVLFSFILLNSCSNESDSQTCPSSEKASANINGEEVQFQVTGRGIDLNSDGSGHTLEIDLSAGVYSPQQNSYIIKLKLPYKKTGKNVINEIYYSRIQNTGSMSHTFLQGEITGKVTTNKNTCFRATFSGSATIDGNTITIANGVIEHLYDDPFL